ncbi:MAG: phenylacetate--CoA ligase family protein, partial [Chitinophagales bacterium]
MNFTRILINNLVFPYMEAFKGNHIRTYIKELQETQSWTPDSLLNQQTMKLKSLLVHCVEKVPAYRSFCHLSSVMVRDPIQALEQFPLLSKSDYQEKPDSYLSEGLNREGLIANRTSGSTGEPVSFYMDRFTVEHYEAARWRGLSWWGIAPADPSIMIWGSPVELSANQSRLHRISERWLKNRIVIPAYSLKPSRINDYIKLIENFSPVYLYGYASSLYLFASLVLEQGKTVNSGKCFKGVVSTAETLFDYQRETIGKAFKAPVINEYGARDAGIIAYQCPAGGMHLTLENLVMEIVDPKTGQCLPAGETGRVAITDLNNFAMPRLRYLVGDMGAMSSSTCNCGIKLPLMQSIDGREVDTFLSRNGELVHGGYWNTLARNMKGIKQYQLVQHDPDHATLRIVKNTQF